MGDELRRLFELIDSESRAGSPPGECTPPVDVTESADAVDVVMDVPGVDAAHLQILFARGTLLIAGHKRSPVCSHSDAAFHLAERAFGRFARVVRLAGAVDAGRARATLAAGELHVTVPRITERRGAEIRLAVESR